MAPRAGPVWGPGALWGVPVPFPCCWRCPFHGDAQEHGRGGCCSRRAAFHPGKPRRGTRGWRGGHHCSPGGAPRRRQSGLSPAGAHFPANFAIAAFFPRGAGAEPGRGAPPRSAGAGRPWGGRRSLPPRRLPRWLRAGRRAGTRRCPEAGAWRGSAPAQARICLWATARWGALAFFPTHGTKLCLY